MSILRWKSLSKTRKKLVNTTRTRKRLADKEQPYTYLCPLRQIGIGLFFVLEYETRRRMSQTDFTTAELALHYRGLGAGPPTSKVQKVKRLPSLPVSELGIFLLHPKLSILRLTRKEYAIAKSKIIKIAPFVLHPRNLSYLRLARKKCTMDFVN